MTTNLHNNEIELRACDYPVCPSITFRGDVVKKMIGVVLFSLVIYGVYQLAKSK